MRIKAIIGKDEYIVAGQLLSDNKNTLKIKRVINILCAIGSACGAVIVLKKDLDVRAAVFLFGAAAFFLLLAFWNRSRWDSVGAKKKINVKDMDVIFDFQQDRLACASNEKRTNLMWDTLQDWGLLEKWLYFIFENKQIVVINRTQLTNSDLLKIKQIIEGWSGRDICVN